MVEVSISKASACPGQTIPDVSIRLTSEIPLLDGDPLSSYREFYAEEGKRLAQALLSVLPGGTVDALLVALLDHKRSLFKVTF